MAFTGKSEHAEKKQNNSKYLWDTRQRSALFGPPSTERQFMVLVTIPYFHVICRNLKNLFRPPHGPAGPFVALAHGCPSVDSHTAEAQNAGGGRVVELTSLL